MHPLPHAARSDSRPGRSAPRGLLLIALALALGCSSKPTPDDPAVAHASGARARATIDANVTDPVRRERALQLVDQLVTAELAYLDRKEVLKSKLLTLNEDYDAERAAFLSVYQELDSARELAIEELLAPLDQLHSVLTEVQWNEVTGVLAESHGSWSAKP